jgi:DNA-binding MarR family transcriptional regulator
MQTSSPATVPDPLLETLAEFRYQLRRFLQFSETAAREAGLEPQQHQLLLQLSGTPTEAPATIAYAAARLGLKHNSAVELVDRCEREGLLSRTVDPADKRRAMLRITRKGYRILAHLTRDHARELNERAPLLVRTLKRVQAHASVTGGRRA